MFNPAEMLRRGGRFHVYWLADSWPQRFAELPAAQIAGTNTVQVCEELMEVIATESSLPSRRFSLRLSSCLLHGLVVVHARKVTDMLWELNMMESTTLRKIEAVNPRRPAHQSTATVREISTDEEAEMEAQAQAQANVVANCAKITLQEEEIPVRTVPNDGFGDETPEERTWQLESFLRDWSTSREAVSLEPEPAATPDDRPLSARLRRQKLSEPREVFDISDEDVPIPDEILPAAAPASPTATLQSEEMILEELVEAPRRRARRRRTLAVDRSLRIAGAVMRDRMIYLKIATASIPLADPKWTSVEALWRRPARGWRDGRLVMSPHLLGLYTRNLAPVQWPQSVQAARDDELAALVRHNKPRASSSRIRPRAATPETAVATQPERLYDLTLPVELFASQELTLPQDQTISPMETSHQPMMGAESVSPELMSAEKGRAKVKRASAEETVDVNRKHQKRSNTDATLAADEAASSPVTEGEPGPSGRPSDGEDSAESLPQGSLDRTEVSLGDSDVTTYSTKLMREHWGPSGTMKKILRQIESGERPVTVETLVRSEPAPLGSNKMAAARCFSSILQLKQAGFITVIKNPETKEIINIGLVPKSK